MNLGDENMMSNFKYCPMCGTQREDGSQFCKNCNFEFLVGKYVKLDDEKSSQDEKIEVEKLSQDLKMKKLKLKNYLKMKKLLPKKCLRKSLLNQMIC